MSDQKLCANGCGREVVAKGECRPCYNFRWKHGISRQEALQMGWSRVRKKLEPIEQVRVRRALRDFERATFRRLVGL